eukprot:05840_2
MTLMHEAFSYWMYETVTYLQSVDDTSVGLKLLVHAALSYCMRPATSVGLKLLVYATLSCCMRPSATSVCGLKLLVYAAFSYCMRPSATSVQLLREQLQQLSDSNPTVLPMRCICVLVCDTLRPPTM